MERRNHHRIPDAKDKGKNTVCHYWVKHYEEPSETYGINGGRISKLMIKVDGVITANYDRGWDVEPAEDDMPTRMAYCILLGKLQLSREFPKSGAARPLSLV